MISFISSLFASAIFIHTHLTLIDIFFFIFFYSKRHSMLSIVHRISNDMKRKLCEIGKMYIFFKGNEFYHFPIFLWERKAHIHVHKQRIFWLFSTLLCLRNKAKKCFSKSFQNKLMISTCFSDLISSQGISNSSNV